MFDLLRYFSISAAVVVAVLGAGIGNAVSWYGMPSLTTEAEQRNEALAAKILSIAWDPHATFLTSTTERDPIKLKQTSQITQIDLAVRKAVVRMPVYKVKLVRPDGLTLYSSDLSEIGQTTDISQPEFASALAGRHRSVLKHVPAVTGLSGQLAEIDSVETHLPKYDTTGHIVGVVEVHSDVTAETARTAAAMWLTALGSAAVSVLLFLALYAIVSRVDRLMNRQYQALQSFNGRLEAEVGQRTEHILRQQRMLGDLMRSSRFQSGTLLEAFRALNEAGAEMLDVERCGLYVPVEKATEFEVIDVFDRRTASHTSNFKRPASFFMSGWTSMEDGDISCISDLESEVTMPAEFINYYRNLSVRSAIDVPIFLGGTLAGILCFRRSGEPHEWRPDEKLAAGALATLAALVLQRIERERAELTVVAGTQSLARQQAVLTTMARDVATASSDIEAVLRPMLRTFAEAIGGQSGGIWILAEDKQSFAFAERYLCALGGIEAAQPRSTFNLSWLDLHRNVPGPVAISDVRRHPQLAASFDSVLAPINVIALLRAPIVVDGALAGFVSCSADKPTEWTTEQTLFATGIASLAALAIERHQRRRAEAQLSANAEMLSRQQNVLNGLLHSESFRNGALSAAMRKLSRTLALEAGIDRVSITVQSADSSKTEYAECYVSALDTFVTPFEGADTAPRRMLTTVPPGKAIVADDAAIHPDTQQYYQKLMVPLDIRSFLHLPIEVGGSVIGMINASICGRQITWSTNQRLFATAIGNLAALTIERSSRQRYERAVAGVAARLEMQQAAIADFMRDRDWRHGGLQDALRRLSRMAADTLGVERIGIWTLALAGDALTALDVHDARTGMHSDGAILSAVEHQGYFAALDEEGLISSCDVTSDARLASLCRAPVTAPDVCSMLAMPILMDGATVGLVCAEKCGTPMIWSEEHRLFVSAITNLVSLVMERHDRKRAEVEVSAGARRLAHMLESFSNLMTSDIVRQGSLQETLRELTRVLCCEVDGDRSAVLLLESRSNSVVSAEAFVRETARFEDPIFPHGSSWLNIKDNVDISAHLAVDDANVDAGLTPAEKALVPSEALGSLLQVPIVIDGEVTGTIRTTTIGRKVRWTTEARLFAAAIAQLASLAVERNTRQRVERDLRHATIAADQANRAKGQFLANMSHEIRTPMNGVFGMTEILMKSQLTERQRRHVSTINESAKTLLTVVNDILDFSRIEDGKMPIDTLPFDVHRCVEGAVELFADEAQRKGLDLRVCIASGTPQRVEGDTGRLRQVCVNLISNAIKFTRRGSVDVRLGGKSVGDGKVEIVIEIIDTGIGIDAATANRLFEPFTQADTSISRRFGGTGLGLSISRHLVTLMGGTITLDSEPERGTRITIVLPCRAAETPAGDRSMPDVLEGKRILVVDDRDTNREIVVAYLNDAGARPVNARTGEMALALLDAADAAGHPFAAAVVDMLMPDMDGVALCRAIRETPRLSATGLVMLTSMSWDGDLKSARELGVAQLMTKPVRRADLLDAVARAVAEPWSAFTAVPDAPRLARTPRFKAHVLVAEDNPVNVEVVCELLRGLGCTVHVAGDGHAACGAFEAKAFDIVLMDCQMPEMDGLMATQRLRQMEQQFRRPRTPVIAVTAHAFEADRVACRAAGMDDYLMKPFTEDELATVIDRWLSSNRPAGAVSAEVVASATSASGAQSPPATHSAGLDHAFLADMRKRRPQLYERLLLAYLTHSPQNVGQLLDAAASSDVQALHLAAHSLKSSSANVGAKRVADIARQIEVMARGGSLDGLAVAADDLRAEFARTQDAMKRALAELKAGA